MNDSATDSIHRLRMRAFALGAASILTLLLSCAHSRDAVNPTEPAVEAAAKRESSPLVAETSASREAPLFSQRGPYHRRINTTSVTAQNYFDQGLNLMFAFNLEEADRSFREAARLDPQAPMAWWGVAYANGPHYNSPTIDPRQNRAAFDAIQKALALAERATPAERSLIQALATRYSAEPPKDRKPLDEAYARAMKAAWRAHPNDPDIGVLYAESVMNLRPWNLWSLDGKTAPGTLDTLATLEKIIDTYPDHPGALHLYIHAVEASPHPELGILAADRLAQQDSVTGGAHLTHMPAHIYMKVGRYRDAAEQNRKASQQDLPYLEAAPGRHFIYMYAAHNLHFLATASMMLGRSSDAMSAARELWKRTPEHVTRMMPEMLDAMLAVPYQVMARFGLWDEALKEPAPPLHLPVSTTFWHYSKGLAHSAKGDFNAARAELKAVQDMERSAPSKALAGMSPAKNVYRIAALVLEADILAKQRKIEPALRLLTQATRLEDRLHYDEPADWYHPVRNILGTTLLQAGRAQEAEAAFREDLARNPDNGWSLYGLWQSLDRQRSPVAAEAERSFRKAWARAEMPTPIPNDRVLVGMLPRRPVT